MLYAVTNRILAKDDDVYYRNIKSCFSNDVEALIIREKELSKEELNKLCSRISEIKKNSKTRIIMNCNKELNMEYALKYGFHGIQMSYKDFHDYVKKIEQDKKYTCDRKIITGVSVHSVYEACDAFEKGADYIIIGHIFKTKCKEGLEPRGLDIIRSIREKNPEGHIVAIGGIDENNASEVIKYGANAFAVMSKIMCNENIDEFLHKLKHNIIKDYGDNNRMEVSKCH